jgi:XTP/dITP diphosphohydrolase
MADIAHGISEKLIYRHPHIYGDVEVENEEDVKKNWEALKLKEGKGKKTVLEGVPKGLPTLVKAQRIQDKVAGVGFDWEKPAQVWEKIQEELAEFQAEVAQGNTNKMEAEFGDVLFSMINYARFLKINPDTALERTHQKFTQRFNYLESKAKALGKSLQDMTLAEMDIYWEEAKRL